MSVERGGGGTEETSWNTGGRGRPRSRPSGGLNGIKSLSPYAVVTLHVRVEGASIDGGRGRRSGPVQIQHHIHRLGIVLRKIILNIL